MCYETVITARQSVPTRWVNNDRAWNSVTSRRIIIYEYGEYDIMHASRNWTATS